MVLASEIQDFTIAFTVEQFLWVCGSIAVIAAAIGVIIKLVQWIKLPETAQNTEILAIKDHQKEQDERMDSIEALLKQDKEVIESITKGNIVVQQGILALMNHAINGNDLDKLEESRDKLQRYLIER